METNEPIPFANVYFNSSFNGTTTDQFGKYGISVRGYEGQGVVVSCVGYESWVIENIDPEKKYKIYLKPSTKLVREIIVRPDDMPFKLKLRIFKREFLGTSKNARHCVIENPEDIYMIYTKLTNTLEAYCDTLLIIRNPSSGYKLTYFLDKFKWSTDSMYYRGNSFFEEDSKLHENNNPAILQRRGKAYLGSRMQFFREIWLGESENLEFRLRRQGSKDELTLEDFIQDGDRQTKYLISDIPIKVSCKGNNSTIQIQPGKRILFTEKGYFDPKYIYWSGKMAQERVGDLLPYEFRPSADK